MSDKPKWSDLFGIAPGFTFDSPPEITKGARLRIVREGEPDVVVVVDDVKQDGPTTILTVASPESSP